MIETYARHFATRRWHGFSSVNKTWHPPSEKNAWAKAASRLTVERQVTVLNLSEAITTATLVGFRPLVGGSSHHQEATRDRLIIGILQKTCARESTKDAMRYP
jgi:hypothetical protein